MNKIATYLNEHLLGEASSSKAMRRRFSRDASILTIIPEIVVFPRVTNDIRKIARFTWQLAEKGHAMGITVRGAGADTTGAAIGKGIVIDTSAHLHNIIAIASKDKLAHVQPGVTLNVLQEALRWQGLSLPQLPQGVCHTTVGGALANNTFGASGPLADSIQKLEVILANGDVIEVGRINRHEVNKKLGLQTFEGEIYRKLSGLIEDNEDLVQMLGKDKIIDNAGYHGIGRVKAKDGSMDLTPLFVGSQGTLGVISEVVLKTSFYNDEVTIAIIAAESGELARDIADRVAELSPSVLLTIDGELFNRTRGHGKRFAVLGDDEVNGALVYIELNDHNDRARHGKLKKLRKLSQKMSISILDSIDRNKEEFAELRSVARTSDRIAEDNKSSLPILLGTFIPHERREEFLSQVAALATKEHAALPTIVNVQTGIIDCYPQLTLDSVSDKQKVFRLMNEYAVLVHKSGGAFVSDGAEGRLKVNSAFAVLDATEVKLFEEIRAIFDPFGTLNPGVKQKNDIRTLVSSLRTSYDTTDFVA